MGRMIRYAVYTLVMVFISAGSSFATTYYVAANGSDSNSGTSKSAPWMHAPGMPNCTATCASANPQPGDSVIFRGGDTWHWGDSSASPAVGGTWRWNWAGTSANCNFDSSSGAVIKTSCIYIGADMSWFSGSSFARPIFTMDNPLSTGTPASCAYLATNGIYLKGGYLVFDNFDIQGACSNSASGVWIVTFAPMIAISNSYFHGWTLASGPGSKVDGFQQVGFQSGTGFVLIDHDVFDGTDSTYGATPYQATGYALGVCSEIAFSVFRKLSNGCVSAGITGAYPGVKSIHDSLFEYMYNGIAGNHGNIIEVLGNSAGDISFYNNTVRHTDEGEGLNLSPSNGGSIYFFNNISYSNANASNCLLPLWGSGGAKNSLYVYNNTIDAQTNVEGNNNGGCAIGGGGATPSNMVVYFENNHLINYPSASVSSLRGSNNGTFTDNGNEVWQSESAANGQGYTASNSYQPTSTSGATYRTGLNLSLSCLIFSPDSALCNGSTSGATNRAGLGTIPTLVNALPPARGILFDAGAYEFSSESSSQPNPPSGLTAAVN